MVKGFDRYAILAKHYTAHIQKWNWSAIKANALANPGISEGSDEPTGFCYLGSVFGVMPSGKFYMPWCSNQTRGDEVRDSVYRNVMEEIAEKHGLWITNGEGDPCDLFACCCLEEAELVAAA